MAAVNSTAQIFRIAAPTVTRSICADYKKTARVMIPEILNLGV
jgi:hypothetical protein